VPVGSSSLTWSAARATTSPSAWRTNSLRIAFARSAASAARSGLMTSWQIPDFVAQVDEDEPPWSRRRAVQPASVTR